MKNYSAAEPRKTPKLSKEASDAATMAKPLKNVKPVVKEQTGGSKFNASLLCGDCLHFHGQPHPRFEAACAKLGIGSKSEAPSCYTPDVTAFRSLSKDTFTVVAALVGSMTPRQSRVLMGTLKYAGSLEKVGMTFLQECYFCMGSEQEAYLDDYMKGFVVGLNKAGGLIVVGTDFLQGSKNSMVAYLDKASILDEKGFNRRRKKLVELGKIRKPQVIRMVKKNTYVVPTLDDGPQVAGKTTKGKRGGAGKSEHPRDYAIRVGGNGDE
jgi:hypothetical protein